MPILIFYLFAVLIEISRILGYVNLILIDRGTSQVQWLLHPYVYDFFYVVALFMIAILGYY